MRSEFLRAPRMKWIRVVESPTAANRRESEIPHCEDDANDEEVGAGEPIVLDSVSPQGLRAVSAHVLRAAAASNCRVAALRLPSRPAVGRFRRRLLTPRARSVTPENVAPLICQPPGGGVPAHVEFWACADATSSRCALPRAMFPTPLICWTASPPLSTSFSLPRVVFRRSAWSVLAQVGLGDEYT